MTTGADPWPALPYPELAPAVDYVRRLVQIAGKYTLDQLFEPAWGNIVLEVTPRGLSTRTLRVRGVSFRVHYRLHDGDVVLEASTGVRSVPLRTQSVAAFSMRGSSPSPPRSASRLPAARSPPRSPAALT